MTAIAVSIHAPAWGATIAAFRRWMPALRFNPRARVGRDDSGIKARLTALVSIHAPAWGATGDGH